MQKLLTGLATGMFFVGMVGITNAALIVTGSVLYDGEARNLVYDDGYDITWLDYSNEIPFQTGATTAWDEQVAWAESLSFTIDGMTYDNWRLPNTEVTILGDHDQITSEMGHLYYAELGLDLHIFSGGTTTEDLNSTEYFDNLRATFYWSCTSITDHPWMDDAVWSFNTERGLNTINYNYFDYTGIAVFDGRVAPIPEPNSILLFGTGLAGLIGLSTRRKK